MLKQAVEEHWASEFVSQRFRTRIDTINGKIINDKQIKFAGANLFCEELIKNKNMILKVIILILVALARANEITDEYCLKYEGKDYKSMLLKEWSWKWGEAVGNERDPYTEVGEFKDYLKKFNRCLHVFDNQRSFDIVSYLNEYLQDHYPLKTMNDGNPYVDIPLKPIVVSNLYHVILSVFIQHGYYNEFTAIAHVQDNGTRLEMCETGPCQPPEEHRTQVPRPGRPRKDEPPVKEPESAKSKVSAESKVSPDQEAAEVIVIE